VPFERSVQKFSSHDEADRAEREYYNSLSPEQRVEVLLELMNRAETSPIPLPKEWREFIALLNSNRVDYLADVEALGGA
jgi:hypothetical protein